jgi:hypothetical protein
MAKEIGFRSQSAGKPETWEKKLPDGRTIAFEKIPHADAIGGGFIYNCTIKTIYSTGAESQTKKSWDTPMDFTREEVENLSRFLDFIAGLSL